MKRHYVKSFLCALTLLTLNVKANNIILHIDSLQQLSQNITISGCDTLIIINNSGYSDYFYLDTLLGGYPATATMIWPDTMIGQWGNDTSYFYNISNYTKLFIGHQVNIPFFYYLAITPCITADDELWKKEMIYRVFPNPIRDKLFIETNDTIISVDILNLQGQTILKIIPNDKHLFIDTKNFAGGTYFIQIRIKGDRQFVKTFTKINSR